MKIANTKFKKTVLIIISTIIFLVLLVFIFISPITKYLVEKYDEEYTGRQITMNYAYVNPFTGYIYFNNLKIFELKNDTVFFSAKGVGSNFALLKLFSRTIEITELTLDQPKGIIIQNDSIYNFNDLIDKFSSDENSDTTKDSYHFNILKVKINNGELYYHEKQIPINYFIKELNIESTGKRWNADTIAVQFSFIPGIGTGDVKGDFTIHINNLNYRLAIVAHNFDLNILEQYFKEMSNYGYFSAKLEVNLKATGNFNDTENITAKGMLAINDFHCGKNKNDDYTSFDHLALSIVELSPKNHKYLFDSISLIHPYLKYERYDYLDNMEMMFGKGGAAVVAANTDTAPFNLVLEIANYIKTLSKNFFQSDYKINRLAIYHGELKFNDYSISEKFAIDFNPVSVYADSIDNNHKRVVASFNSGIEPYGYASVTLSINPKDSGDYDMQYQLQKLPMAMFNPYTISYTSYPLDRGTIELNGVWNVRNSIIQSNNHLLLIDPRLTKRLKNKDLNWLPVPLIMSFVRERGNVIDYEIPITGDLKNPKFHLKDVMYDILKNIFVKPPTTPYRMQVKNTENEIEKTLTLKWKMRQCALLPRQEKFINKIAEFLLDNPEASISVYPLHYIEKEKEYILFFEAKKKYFLVINNKKNQSFNEADSMKVDKMSVKDSLFIQYLNKHLSDSMLFTIQDKCKKFIGSAIVNTKFKRLINERKDVFMLYFKDKAVENRVKIYPSENNIPYNGFSFYKIVYKGELPEDLIEAYQQMDELNKEVPRKKFNNKREKNKKE